MNNEKTMILNNSEETKDSMNVNSQRKSNMAKNAAYVGGGFLAGVAVGYSGSAKASETSNSDAIKQESAVVENIEEDANVAQSANEKQNTVANNEALDIPKPEDVLLATDEGLRVAQVNDNASFADAFAEARAQVGAGGTFEWKGNVYSTYTEEEWNNMSASERAEFQSKVDYQSIAGESNDVKPNPTAVQGHTNVSEEVTPANAEMVDNNSNNEGVKVLGVEAVVDSEGNPMTVAAIELQGEQALLVDVDNNGIMDVIIADENGDGQITENEFYDVSEAHIATEDLQQMEVVQNDDMQYACNGDMPDYMNDADVSSMV